MKFLKTNMLATEIVANFEKNLITIEKKVQVKAGKTTYVMQNVGYSAYEVKTIYAKTDTGGNLIVALFDDENHGNEIYQSLSQPIVQDIVAIVNKDNSGNKAVYFAINNPTALDFIATIRIKCVNL